MTIGQIKAYCLGKWKTYEDYPFGDIFICYKLNKKVFAQLYPLTEDYKVTLKCTADAGQFYRQVYPGTVVGGYHCPPLAISVKKEFRGQGIGMRLMQENDYLMVLEIEME